MTRSLLVLVLMAASLVPPLRSPWLAVATAQEKKDQDLIQGTWKVVKLEHNGKVNKEHFREGIWVFKGKEVTLRDKSGKEWFKGTFVLDADQKTKTIDMTWADGVLKGKTQKG